MNFYIRNIQGSFNAIRNYALKASLEQLRISKRNTLEKKENSILWKIYLNTKTPPAFPN
tara:strand:+ start:66 stop:242 length:177 start_codon:yes stop_codon:yes gene_type:complete